MREAGQRELFPHGLLKSPKSRDVLANLIAPFIHKESRNIAALCIKATAHCLSRATV
jgi:hypothetical protein